MPVFLAFVFAYFLGSFPAAVVIGKLFYNTDVRMHGSKNPGATNTLRILGKKAALVVLLMDILKGFIATKIVLWFSVDLYSIDIINAQLLCGLVAILGHIFPIFLKFKGGKGIATAFGVALSLYFTASIIALLVFIIVVGLTKYVSLGSIISVIIFSLVSLFYFREKTLLEQIFFVLLAIIVIVTHRKNIYNLINCKENKLDYKK